MVSAAFAERLRPTGSSRFAFFVPQTVSLTTMTASVSLDSLTELERLALAARRLGGGILAEDLRNNGAGGTELSGYRDYAAGDDRTHVDWNVCARHDELRVRQYGGRPDRHVRVLLDCSASMGLGAPAARLDVARRIAAALGYVALDRQHKVTVVPFADRVQKAVGPLRGKGRAGKLLRELERLSPRSQPTDFHRVAERFVRIDQTPGPVVVVSDLCPADTFTAGLNVLRMADCSPRVVHVADTHEPETITAGDIELFDVESGSVWQVTLTESQVRKVRRLLAEQQAAPVAYCSKFRVPYVRVGLDETDGGFLQDVVATRSIPRIPT